MPKKRKHSKERSPLLIVVIIMTLFFCSIALILIWSSKTLDSPLAEKIRNFVGIRAVAPEVVEAPVAPPVEVVEIIEEPMPEPVPVIEEPPPITPITFLEITRSKNLWPKSVKLKLSKQIPIRYKQLNYGYMEFSEDSTVTVQSLKAPAEIFGSVNGNFISLSVDETDFVEWFTEEYAERHVLQPIAQNDDKESDSIPDIDTPEGEKAFWSEMRIWCHQNYESISLEVGEEGLTFKWLPREDAPINYQLEARTIARTYLLKRAKYGGTDNFATCEIKHPTTDELLGASSMFIPRL
ncbi:MAG: hypothetical protein ACSHX8_13315 [Opitutaceae bacterium]